MGHTHGHAQRRLPVSIKFMASKFKIPVGHAIQFVKHTFTAKLMYYALALLARIILDPCRQHIHAGELHTPIEAHGFADGARLRFERRFIHDVSCQRDAMGFTPRPHLIDKGAYKPLGQMIVITVPRDREPIPAVKKDFRQVIHQILAVLSLIGAGQVVGERDGNLFPVSGSADVVFKGELRLIGEDGGNCFAEFFAQ